MRFYWTAVYRAPTAAVSVHRKDRIRRPQPTAGWIAPPTRRSKTLSPGLPRPTQRGHRHRLEREGLRSPSTGRPEPGDATAGSALVFTRSPAQRRTQHDDRCARLHRDDAPRTPVPPRDPDDGEPAVAEACATSHRAPVALPEGGGLRPSHPGAASPSPRREPDAAPHPSTRETEACHPDPARARGARCGVASSALLEARAGDAAERRMIAEAGKGSGSSGGARAAAQRQQAPSRARAARSERAGALGSAALWLFGSGSPGRRPAGRPRVYTQLF